MTGRAPSDLSDLGRFSEPAVLVMASLADGPKHGYAIIQDVARFHGARMEPGTLYGVLARLEPLGWIAPLPVVGRRRPYRLTKTGAAVLQARLATMQRILATARTRLKPGHATGAS